MTKPNIVFYHAHCADGMTAAWAMSHLLDDSADYVPVTYDGKEYLSADIKNRDVFFVDFSPNRGYLMAASLTAQTITILDHHKTAAADMADPPSWAPTNVFITFDMNHSGARLAWDYVAQHCAEISPTPPTLVNYVEDRDLWNWKLRESKEISAVIGLTPYNMDDWSNLNHLLTNSFDIVVNAGRTILGVREFDVDQNLSKLVRRTDAEGRVYLFGNVTEQISETGNQALKRNPDVRYTCTYFDKPSTGQRIFSLRSEGDFDVSAIAKANGGGGHKNAAGFSRHVDVSGV